MQLGLSRGAEAGGWSRGVPGSLPAERHKAASRTSQKVLPSPHHFKPPNNFPVPASLLNPLGASPTASTEGGEKGLGCWNYRINLSASESKHLPGSRRQPGCQDPPAPGITGRGNRVQLLRDCGHKSWVVCRTQSRQEGKGCPAEPRHSRRANHPERGESEGLSAGAAGQDGPFPLGSWLRTHQLSCGCWTGRRGEEQHQLTARGARSPHVQVPGSCALLELPSHRRRGWEEEEEGWEEGEEHQAAWLQFDLLRPLHNF